jgi:putative transposase
LNSYDDLGQARTAIAKYMTFFNERRPHQSLGYQTPEAFYAGNMTRAA